MSSVGEVAAAIATASEEERSHGRLPKRSIAMSMIANAPRRFAELVQKGVPTA